VDFRLVVVCHIPSAGASSGMLQGGSFFSALKLLTNDIRSKSMFEQLSAGRSDERD
jgi:hypothetical protein